MAFIFQDLLQKLSRGSMKGDPFSVLGIHEAPDGKGLFIRTIQPQAKEICVLDKKKKVLNVFCHR